MREDVSQEPARSQPPKPSKSDETKARILDAALVEFAVHGVAGARVDRIAAAARCNKNLLYVYFGSKEQLFMTVLEQRLVEVYEEIEFTPEDLPGFAGRVFDFAIQRQDLMRLLIWSTLEESGGVPAQRAASHDAKVEKLDAVQEGGGDAFTAEFVLTTVMALATAWTPALPYGFALHPEREPAVAEVRAQVIEAVRRLTA